MTSWNVKFPFMQVCNFSISKESLLPNGDEKSIIVLQRYVSTVEHVYRQQYDCIYTDHKKMPLRQLHGMVFARCWKNCTILRTMHDSLYITLNGLHDTMLSFLFRCIEARFRASTLMVTGIVDTVPSRYNNLHITASSWHIFVIAKGFLSTQEKIEMLWLANVYHQTKYGTFCSDDWFSFIYFVQTSGSIGCHVCKTLAEKSLLYSKRHIIQSTLISKSSIWLQVE